MKNRIRSCLAALERVVRFLDAHADVAGPISTSAARLTLEESLTRANTYAIRQAEATERRKKETLRRRDLITALRIRHLRPIAVVAQVVLSEGPESEFLAEATAPGKPSELVQRAHQIARVAKPHAELFVRQGLDAGFLDHLVEAAKAVRASLDVDRQERDALMKATSGLETEDARARRALDTVDALLLPRIVHDPELLMEWRAVSRRAVVVHEEAACTP